ncbi:DNA-directed RNA polymerase II subunit D [Intoshia linei]|uniref:DNA-directed RNA polymerase II subunit D n=1 Tax=Intoshia linei TaxID=1819745 RepID=A0A177B479_9BILA|nr:DNA-directed RNA polymerase II subunit D [Intoshia linei]
MSHLNENGVQEDIQHLIFNKEKKEEKIIQDNSNSVFFKSYDYVSRLNNFNNSETIESVKGLLSKRDLHPFELVSLANICPTDVNECKSLYPSLKDRFSDSEILEITKDLQTFKNLQN